MGGPSDIRHALPYALLRIRALTSPETPRYSSVRVAGWRLHLQQYTGLVCRGHLAPAAAAAILVCRKDQMALWARGAVVSLLTASLVVGVWAGLTAIAQPSLETLDQKDSIELWADEHSADLSIVWTLTKEGLVDLRITHVGLSVDRAPATAYVVFSCGARLNNVTPKLDFQQISPPEYGLTAAGDPAGCGVLDEPIGFRELEYQLLSVELEPGQSLLLTGQPVEPWTSETLNARLARSPQMNSISVGPDEGDPKPFSFNNYPLLEELEAVLPSSASFSVVLQATATEERQAVYGPGGSGVTESTGNSVIDWGSGPFVDSVRWSVQDAQVIYSGVARWSEPGGLNQSQLLLLMAGALLGVATSIAVELLLRAADQRPKSAEDEDVGSTHAAWMTEAMSADPAELTNVQGETQQQLVGIGAEGAITPPSSRHRSLQRVARRGQGPSERLALLLIASTVAAGSMVLYLTRPGERTRRG